MNALAPAPAPLPPAATFAPPTSNPWRMFVLTAGAVFVVTLDATAAVAAFPVWRESFAGAAPALLSWILNAYTIVYAALLVTAGRWADGHGRARAFQVGLIWFGVGSVWCAVVDAPLWLVAGRVAQAVGAAWLTPSSLALALGAFPRARRGEVMGLWGAIGALAAAVGPAVGAGLMELTSWRAIFWINVPLVALMLVRFRRAQVGRSAESEQRFSRGAFDPLGTALLVAGVGLLAWALVDAGSETGAASSGSWLRFAAGLGLLGALAAWAVRRPGGAIDASLFRSPSFALATLLLAVFGAAFSAMFLNSYLFLTGVWGLSRSLAGLASVPGPLVVIPSAILAGRLVARWGHRRLLASGGLLFALGQIWYLLRVGNVVAYWSDWLPGQLLTGAAIGLVLPTLFGAAMAALRESALAEGNAMATTARQLGGALGIALAVAWVGGVETAAAHHRLLWGFIAAAGGLVAGLSLGLRDEKR